MEHRSRRRGSLIATLLAVAAAAALLAPPLHAQAEDPSPAAAQEITSLTLSQLHLQPPAIRAYLQPRDARGAFVPALGEARLSASLAGQPVPVTGVQPFAESGEGAAYLFLVDNSRSIQQRQFESLRNALGAWVTSLRPQDQAAIVVFGTSIELVTGFTADTAALARGVAALRLTDDRTRFHDAVIHGLELVERQDTTVPARRVIVVVSDGQDDVVGGISEREVVERIRATHVPIFGIGLYHPPRTPAKEQGLQTLGAFARASGGQFLRADTIPAAEVYAQLTRYAQEVHVAALACEGCPRDGDRRHLQLALETGTRALTAGADVRLVWRPADEPSGGGGPAPWWQQTWVLVAALALVLGILAILFGLRRRRQPEVEQAEDLIIDGGPWSPRPDSGPGDGGPAPLPPDGWQKPARPLHIRLTPVGLTALGSGQSVKLVDHVRIGRSPTDADVAFPEDLEISAVHCELVRRDRHVVLRDLESTNGTLVNGVPIYGEQRVENDDKIGIGRSELRLTIYEGDDEDRA